MALSEKDPGRIASVSPRQFVDLPNMPPSLVEAPGAQEWNQALQRFWGNFRRALGDSFLDSQKRSSSIVSEFSTDVATLTARIATEESVRASADGALASRATTLESQVQTPGTGLLARVSTIETTYATDSEVSASISTALVAAASDAQSRVNIEASARIAADGAIHARWGVAIDVNGRIVGRVNLDGTNQSSEFKVSVDKFVVENANGTITAMDIRTGGKIVFGNDIMSDNYGSGDGWLLTRYGDFIANSGTFRGTVRIGDASAFGTGTGIWMGMDGGVAKFRVGNPAGARIEWDGSAWNVVSFPSSAAPVAFADALEAFKSGGNFGLTTNDDYGVTPSGGSGSYTYSWARASGSTAITAQSSTSRFTKFVSSGGTNEVLEAYFKCTVSDGSTSVDSDQIRVEFIHGTPP